jgi:hypothetical protein
MTRQLKQQIALARRLLKRMPRWMRDAMRFEGSNKV